MVASLFPSYTVLFIHFLKLYLLIIMKDFLGDDFKSQGSHVPYNVADFSTQVHIIESKTVLDIFFFILCIACMHLWEERLLDLRFGVAGTAFDITKYGFAFKICTHFKLKSFMKFSI